MVAPDSLKDLPSLEVLGNPTRKFLVFAYGPLTLFGNLFHDFLLTLNFHVAGPTTPTESVGLGSAPFARRLLRASQVISFPPDT